MRRRGVADAGRRPGTRRPALERQNAGEKPEPPRRMEPVRIFDNLWYFGFNTVGAWAIQTSDGIILIDALNTVEEAETIIEPALRGAGLNPALVKYVIVGHGHFDHFGGVPYFQQKYGSRVAMSGLDWDLIERPNPNANPAQANRPKRDVVVADGQTITVADTAGGGDGTVERMHVSFTLLGSTFSVRVHVRSRSGCPSTCAQGTPSIAEG